MMKSFWSGFWPAFKRWLLWGVVIVCTLQACNVLVTFE
jgi:hypothetical protein